MSKPRVVKDYEKLETEIKEQVKLNFQNGFDKHLITFKNHKNKFVSALPFETEDRYFLIRMSQELARKIIKEDEDYDELGHMKTEIRAAYTDKYKVVEKG